jgi:ABC-type lipoprotein release transport system permease subunit
MMMLALAWKNIWRNKKRSLIILIATAIGLTAGLFTVGMITGMYDSVVYSGINREIGELQIHTSAFKKDQLISQNLPQPDSIMNIVKKYPNIKSAASHSLIEGMASSPTSSSGGIIIGINPDGEKQVTSISKSLIDGSYLEEPNTVLIGNKLAEKLKLKLRSKIVLSFSGLDGSIIYGAFRISGIYRTESTNFDASNIFISRSDLIPLLDTEVPVHEIIIRVKNSGLLEMTQLDLGKMVQNFNSTQDNDQIVVENWKEIAPELKLTADSSGLVNTIFLGIILFALLFGLTNTLLMSVLERVRDFGVLLAVGMYRRRLFAMIILESFFLSFTGGIIGVLFGWGITSYFHSVGIDLSIVSDGLSAYGIPTMLYPYIRSSVYGSLSIMMIAASIIAALYPAIKAVRLKPVESIRIT